VLIQNRHIRNALAGGLGGLLGWLLLIEPFVAPLLDGTQSFGTLLAVDALFGAIVGVFIGAALGGAEGVADRAWHVARRGALIGGAAGLVGGVLGLIIGELVYQPLAWLCFVGRAIAWGVFGVILGASTGVIRRSWNGLRHGALGGLIGGTLGGFLFDLVGAVIVTLTGFEGLSRGVALTVLGASIGFWIAAVERSLAPALLKVISGRMEGKEFLLDKPLLTVGSAERADVAIFGDAEILAKHALLRWEQEVFVLDVQPGAAVTINGQPVQHQTLQHDDQLMIGRTRCIFRQKVRQSAARAALSGVPTAVDAGTSPRPRVAVTGLKLVEVRTGRQYVIASATTRIGREADNEIVIDDVTISGHHALIQRDNERFVVYDQGSRNGVYVNGRRVSGANLLRSGWQVQLGDCVFRIEEA
jgi:pSer/pThr/pTyr-binding forkhead associated (FHA) protein